MRPWFTFVVICLIALSLLVFLFVVDFVLINRAMFEQSFNIQIRFFAWSHTWAEIQFMYIIATSMLLGAIIIAITTLGLDTQRALKLMNLRKELKRLQQSLQEAQANLSKVSASPEEQEGVAETIEPPSEAGVVISPSPDEITKSFEDAVETEDFLESAKKRREEELQGDQGEIEPPDDEQPATGFSGSPAEHQEEVSPSETIIVAEELPEQENREASGEDDASSQQAIEDATVAESPEKTQKTKENESDA